jgi:hypothetical protein
MAGARYWPDQAGLDCMGLGLGLRQDRAARGGEGVWGPEALSSPRFNDKGGLSQAPVPGTGVPSKDTNHPTNVCNPLRPRQPGTAGRNHER